MIGAKIATNIAARAVILAAGLALLPAGCKREVLDPTSMVVTVNTDLIVGTDLDGIDIDVTSARGTERVPFALGAASDLPVSLALLPRQDRMESFQVTATARLSNVSDDVVSQSRLATFVPGQTSHLSMNLSRSCIGVPCPDDQTCDQAACVPRDGSAGPGDGGMGGAGGAGGAGGGTGGTSGTGGAPVTGDLKVQYSTSVTADKTTSIAPVFNIVNSGTTAYPLQALTLRYWFTADGATSDMLVGACDYATAGKANVTLDFQPVTPPRTEADYYLEIGFTAAAGNLGVSGAQSQVQTRFNTATFNVMFYQPNDYSFDPTKAALADWPQVTLYQNGVLIWGLEPS